MATIHAALVRHARFEKPADTPSAHLPHPLTRKGRRQAEALAETLEAVAGELGAAIHPVIDASPLLRAWQTATIAGGRLSVQGVRVEVFDALMERSLGSAANLTRDQIRAAVDADPRLDSMPEAWKLVADYRPPFPGAESLTEAGTRAARHIRQRVDLLASQTTGPTLAVFVGHSSALCHAARALGVLSAEQTRRRALHYCGPIILRFDDDDVSYVSGEWKLRPA